MENRGNFDVLAEYKQRGLNYTSLVGLAEWIPSKNPPYIIGEAVKRFDTSDLTWKDYIAKNANNDPTFNISNWDQISKTVGEIRASISVNAPLAYNNIDGIIYILPASSGVNGYLSAVDWQYFDAKINNSDKNQANGVPGIDATRKIQLVNLAGTQVSTLENSNSVPRAYTLPDRNLAIGSKESWSPSTIYEVGARALNHGLYYECLVSHTSSSLDFITDYLQSYWKKLTFTRGVEVSMADNTILDFGVANLNLGVAQGKYEFDIGTESFSLIYKASDYITIVLEEDYFDIYVRNGFIGVSQIKDTPSKINIYVNKIDETMYIQNLTGNSLDLSLRFTPKGV